MAESRSHLDLVQVALDCIKKIVPENEVPFIQVDSPDTQRPGMVESFIPDVYLETSKRLVIGEAKTIKDFETKHSKAQYRAYIGKCQEFCGESWIVISVPWQLTITAKNVFRRLLSEVGSNDIRVIIVNELGNLSEL